MLMPQKLTAWVPTASVGLNYYGWDYIGYEDGLLSDGNYANPSAKDASRTLSYLAIDCEIYHSGIVESEAKIYDGYIFVPFETKGIAYNTADMDNKLTSTADEWLAGYKITYCLDFGGGYVVEEDHTNVIPEPGCIPDTETFTLRTVTYTATTDTWVNVDASQDLGDFENGVDTDTSGPNS